MKTKIIFLLTLFILSSYYSTAQKEADLMLIKDNIHILENDLLDISAQSYEFEAFTGNPQLDLPDMFYFNAYEEWKNNAVSRLAVYDKTKNDNSNVLDWSTFRFDLKEIQENTFHPEKYFQPFYFKKYEVTNREYREFIEWVRDSLAHDIIGNFIEGNGEQLIDWTTEIDWTDETLDEMFIINSLDSTKEIDKSLLNYSYRDEFGQNFNILVYPEPITQIRFEYGQPALGDYLEHPAYSDYPVVNINYYQAIAFCDWKTQELRKKLHELQLPFNVEVRLPKAYEWQWIARHTGDNISFRLKDIKWKTSLVTKGTRDDALHLENTYSLNARFRTGNFTFPVNYRIDNKKQFLGFRKKLSFEEEYFLKLTVDRNDVYCMANNVSEWMEDNYVDNWQPAFKKYLENLKNTDDEASTLLRQTQLYYDEQNDKNGQLVYGGNWLYPSEQLIDNKNIIGLFEKMFVSPHEAHSTIGFRYVVRVKKKN